MNTIEGEQMHTGIGVPAKLAIAFLAAAGATACLTASAHATGVTATPSGMLEVKAAPGETNSITVKLVGDVSTVIDSAGVQASGGSGCLPSSPTELVCTGPYSGVLVDAADGNDFVTLSSHPSGSGTAARVLGGPGDDFFVGGDSTSGPTASLALLGEAGDDTIFGSPADETIEAGEGDDTVFTSLGRDTIDAGGGNDTIRKSSDITPETIVCGGGSDTVLVGAGDRLKIDCETIGGSIACTKPKCQVAAKVVAGKRVLSAKTKRKKRKASRAFAENPRVALVVAKVEQAMGAGANLGVTLKMRQTGFRKGKKLGANREKINFELYR